MCASLQVFSPDSMNVLQNILLSQHFQVKDPQNYIYLAADPHLKNVVPGTPQIQIFECTKD